MVTLTVLEKNQEQVSAALLERHIAQAPEGALQDGAAALKDGQYERALSIFERLSKEAGRSFWSESGRAFALRKLGRLEEAIRAFRGALGFDFDKEVLRMVGVTEGSLGRHNDALATFKEVIERWPDDVKVWMDRSAPLTNLARCQEADESLEKAHARRRQLSAGDVGLLYYLGALVSLALGVSSIQRRWLPDLEAATNTFMKWRSRARRDRQSAAFEEAVEEMKKAELSQDDRNALEEFLLSVRLSSIRDPFKGWQALSREISKGWPEGVSAVDAIREQRR